MKVGWKHWVGCMAFLVAAAAIFVFAVFETGLVEQWMRRAIVNQIAQRTGARAEMAGFHLHIWSLQAEIDGLTIHGLETQDSPPLFHADRVDVAIRILSFFGKQIALDKLIVEQPRINVQVDPSGRSNLPAPHIATGTKPWRETLFSLRIGELALRQGSATFNNQHAPLAVRGRDLAFDLHYDTPPTGMDSYIGNLAWRQVEVTQGRNLPFHFDLSAKFQLHRDAFELDELICKLPHSELDLRAELPSFAQADWNLRYRGKLSLADVQTIFRAPTTPDGITDFSGEARYAAGQWTASGYYRSHDIRMPYEWFHAKGLETWGNYEIAKRQLVVPNLSVKAFGGGVHGRLAMDLGTLAFRTETHLQGTSLAAVFAALDNPNFPVNALHWDASMDVISVNTWEANFQHFRSMGESLWSPPAQLSAGAIGTSARIDYDYTDDNHTVTVAKSEITAPKMRIEMNGELSATDSAMDVKFHAGDLLEWDDFIDRIRGTEAEPERIAGIVDWSGRILGPLTGPTFAGHAQADAAVYDKLEWDTIAGDMEYSPDEFRLTNATVERAHTSAKLNLYLQLDGNWGFVPSSTWTLDAQLARSPSDDLQTIFDMTYPVTGLLSGDFHGSGTREEPVLNANIVLEDIDTNGFHFDRLSGQLHLEDDQMQLSQGELRQGAGRITGNFLYRAQEQQAEFNLNGIGMPVEKIAALQTTSLPLSGQLDFNLKGSGPLRTPTVQGDFKVANLKLGAEVEGIVDGKLNSDGRNARLELSSELTKGKLQGEVNIGLTGDQPVSGRLTVEQFDIDPFIVASLHLSQLTSHSSSDGVFSISGALHQPESIEVDADISRISFAYEFVQLTNESDIRVTYRRNEVRVDQARLHGTDTDIQLSGTARFDRDRPIRFTVSGGLNLRLLKGVLPDLEAHGAADANVSIEGTIDNPQVTGRASVKDASANYAEFPVGLSKVNGDFVFDKSRLVFDRLTAESGGGQLTLNGSVTYGEGPVRYDVSAQTAQVRIRYPMGMSWLASGTIQLSGSNNAAVLSGHVLVQRLLFGEGVDLASFFAAASETATQSVSTSPFLQNLTFDVEGQADVGARIEWTGAQIDVDGNVRLRGTWDRPILLGNIHLLGGEMPFRGNTYELTRGDINFANPFRLDPVLNVEATSVINQYQVTIDFSGQASRLSLNYRSDPPLPDSDIIALLALGSTGEESGLRSQTASQNYGATALLSEAISSGLGGRIQHLFGISQFRVDPFVAGAATESNAAARVTIEEQVAHDLTITYSTNAATSNQYQLIQVEYAVKRDLSVVFLRDINGTYGMDIKWVKHLK